MMRILAWHLGVVSDVAPLEIAFLMEQDDIVQPGLQPCRTGVGRAVCNNSSNIGPNTLNIIYLHQLHH